jgi:hypothetical protein
MSLGVLCCWIFMGHARSPGTDTNTGRLAAAGALLGAVAAIRPPSVVFALPFLVRAWAGPRRGRLLRIALVLVPVVAVLFAHAVYNARTFGSYARNGYQFWCPLPYDYAGQVLSPRYLRQNLAPLKMPSVAATLLLGLLGFGALNRANAQQARRFAVFFVLGPLPLALSYLLYFWVDVRFHIPLLACCAVAAGAGAAALMPRQASSRLAIPCAVAAAALAALLPRAETPRVFSINHRLALAIAARTPSDAAIVTTLNPVYLEPLALRGTQRKWVAATRKADGYSDKAVAMSPIDPRRAPLRWPDSHRHPLLRAAGARDAVEWTADENPDAIAAWLRQGRPVYLAVESIDSLGAAWQGLLRDRFVTEPVEEHLWRLALRG